MPSFSSGCSSGSRCGKFWLIERSTVHDLAQTIRIQLDNHIAAALNHVETPPAPKSTLVSDGPHYMRPGVSSKVTNFTALFL